MNKKTDIERERLKTAKAVRTAIRLKHSMNADDEINEKLPDVLVAFDSAIASGKRFELDIKSVVE